MITAITDEAISDILVTALEGGSNYWMNDSEVCRNITGATMGASDDLMYTGIAGETNVDDKGWTPFNITLATIRGAITAMEKDEYMPLHIRLMAKSLMEDPDYDYDAGDADTIIQYAIFQQLIFG